MAAARELVLVTGSAGYVGTALVQALTPEYQVVGLDRKPPSSSPADADFIECDLTSDESVGAALEHALSAAAAWGAG